MQEYSNVLLKGKIEEREEKSEPPLSDRHQLIQGAVLGFLIVHWVLGSVPVFPFSLSGSLFSSVSDLLKTQNGISN